MTPLILWGDGLANTWTFPCSLDNPVPSTKPVGAISEATSGSRDFWLDRTDNELSFVVPFVPKSTTGSVTGYATPTTGVREALAWLTQNVGAFYPDSTNPSAYHFFYLLEYSVARSPGGARYHITMKIRDRDSNAFAEY